MKNSIILYSHSRIKRNHAIYLISFFTIMSLILIIVCSYYTSLIASYKEMENINSLKLLEVKLNEEEYQNIYIDKIKNIRNVIDVIPKKSYELSFYAEKFNVDNLSGNFLIRAMNENEKIKIVDGNKEIFKEKFKIICPINFFPHKDLNSKNIGMSKSFDLKPFINSKMKFSYLSLKSKTTKTQEFAIVGLYQNNSITDDEATCLTSKETLMELTKQFPSRNHNLIVEVDSIINTKVVYKFLRRNNFNVKIINELDLEFYDSAMNLSIFSISIYSLLIAFFVFTIIKIDIEKKYENIKLYYYLGYPLNKITDIYMIGNIIVWGIAMLLTSTITIFIDSILFTLIRMFPGFFNTFPIVINYSILAYIIFSSLFVVLISTFLNIKKFKKEYDAYDKLNKDSM